MAQFPDLGKHCSVQDCNQIDFLPFECKDCGLQYCKNHRLLHTQCCMLSKTATRDTKNQDEHKPRSFPCSLAKCEGSELMEVICDQCSKNFCLKHRHQTDHDCEKMQVEPEKMVKTKELVDSIKDRQHDVTNTKRQGIKSKQLSSKVMLMKLKQQAKGDLSLPQEERIFLNVVLPVECGKSQQAMFFSRLWSIGRAVDYTASVFNLTNKNNLGTSQKLRMFSGKNGNLVPTDCLIAKLLGDSDGYHIENGATVILEYVNNDCKLLGNYKEYLSFS